MIALLSSNESFEGIHFKGMLMSAAILAVALPLVTYAAGKASKIDDNKRSKLWGEMLCGFVVGALSYVIAATIAPVELPKELDWFNCSANTGRVLSFGFGLAGYYGAVRCMSNTVASNAASMKQNLSIHSS